ncbi:TetR/AcrR family transcriptional regulator [Larkinella soli]|uniref:TetR/AcrR family transcriptional regulator n=1 Tax=Larkinella soli TaxID=1770527 RepID=UPI000FFB9CED|nr:TetR/AcrR family transcriptional regulator [Larkinella soli]
MAKREDKRELIIQAASECFARFGYDKTTLDDIGKAVRLNKASLYYYYKSKDDLFIEVILRESTEYMTTLIGKVRLLNDPEAQILHFLIERLRYYKHVLNLHQLSVESLQTLEPVFDQLYEGVRQQEIEFLQTLVQRMAPVGESRKIAEMLLLVADALKNKAVRDTGAWTNQNVDYSRIEVDTGYIIQLIMKGLKEGR